MVRPYEGFNTPCVYSIDSLEGLRREGIPTPVLFRKIEEVILPTILSVVSIEVSSEERLEIEEQERLTLKSLPLPPVLNFVVIE